MKKTTDDNAQLLSHVTSFLTGDLVLESSKNLKDYAQKKYEKQGWGSRFFEGSTAAKFMAETETPFSKEEKVTILTKLKNNIDTNSYLKDYQQWLQQLDFFGKADSQLLFLEFLAYKNHHRLNMLLKLAREAKPYHKSYWPHYTGAAVMTMGAVGYFSYYPSHVFLIIEWMTQQAPALTMKFIDFICLPLNMPRVSMIFSFSVLLYNLYFIWTDHVPSTVSKALTSLKLLGQAGLNILAHVLCYLHQGILTPHISILFILSSLWTTLYTFVEFRSLAAPKQPETLDINTQINYIEEKFHHDQKERELHVEIGLLVFFTLGTVVVIFTMLPVPYLSLFFAAIQFFLSQAKILWLESETEKAATKMQEEIAELYKRTPNADPNVELVPILTLSQTF